MGGTGEKVRYTRLRAEKNDAVGRQTLKDRANAIIDANTQAITIIALVEEPGGAAGGGGGPG